MDNELYPHKHNKIILIFTGLAGINLVILIHELGHFLAACYFGVPVSVFSLGFGPALIKIPFKETIFQIALIPFGGYVELNENVLAAQPYFSKMIIMLAGIVFNMIFAYSIISYFKAKKTSTENPLKNCLNYIQQEHKSRNAIIGPIGLINIIGHSFQQNIHFFWLILALVSLNVGFFNLLPLPFFDGGKALLYTIEAATGKAVSQDTLSILSFILFALFALLISAISINDVKKFQQN